MILFVFYMFVHHQHNFDIYLHVLMSPTLSHNRPATNYKYKFPHFSFFYLASEQFLTCRIVSMVKYLLDIFHQHRHHLIHHCIVFHQRLSLYVDNKSVHHAAYNSVHMDLEPSNMAPIHIELLQMASHRIRNIVDDESLAPIRDNPSHSKIK